MKFELNKKYAYITKVPCSIEEGTKKWSFPRIDISIAISVRRFEVGINRVTVIRVTGGLVKGVVEQIVESIRSYRGIGI